MSSKICESRENLKNGQSASDCQLQKLDITLRTKMNSEQEPTKDMRLQSDLNSSSVSESGPLSERQLSNFDNQTNVKI